MTVWLKKNKQYYAKSIYLHHMPSEPISSYISMFLLSSNGLLTASKEPLPFNVFISDLEGNNIFAANLANDTKIAGNGKKTTIRTKQHKDCSSDLKLSVSI